MEFGMISIVIADDEPNIVHGLVKLIEGQNLGVTIVGLAYDGLEALSIVRKEQPDILISDISMPKLNGIKLIKEMKKEKIKTKVIFLSGYQEFEYARSALQYGAVDYLLKPINQKQLKQNILNIIADKRFKNITEDEKMDLIETFNSDVMDINIRRHVGGKNYKYIVINLSYSEKGIDKTGEKDILNFSITNAIEQLLDPFENKWITNKKNDIFVLIEHSDKDKLNDILNNLPYEIIEDIKQKTGINLTISIGKMVDGIKNISESYDSAIDMMTKRFFYDKGVVIYYEDNTVSKYNTQDLFDAQENIALSLLSYNKGKVCKSLENFISVLKDVSNMSKDLAISYCMATVVQVKNKLKEADYDINYAEIGEKINTQVLHEHINYSSLQYWIKSYFLKIYQAVLNYIQDKDNDIIHQVKVYIDEHYGENINLKDIANIVHMNANYFSGYFKKHTGINFKDYLTCIRMKEAEKLLLTSDYKVYEIAECVGLTDYRHFSHIFKERHKCNPKDYKQKILKDKTIKTF